MNPTPHGAKERESSNLSFCSKKQGHHRAVMPLFLADNYNFDTNAPLFEVRGKVILEGVMHHIRPINLDLRL